MTKELQEKLFAKYDKMFRDRSKPMSQTCMCWGISCDDGWYHILEYMCRRLQKIQEEYDVTVIFDQIKEKFGCYDEETEVLTKDGWKLFCDVTQKDKIASLKNGTTLIYEKPTEIIAEHYSGKMYRLKTRGVDLLVTPNHDLYVAKGTYWNGKYTPPKRVDYDFELTKPEKYFGKNKRFKKDAKWEGAEIYEFTLDAMSKTWNREKFGKTGKKWPERIIKMDDWLNFLGWYIAEGCISSNPKQREISISANNTDNGYERNVVLEAIRNIGFDPSLSQEDKSAVVYKIFNKPLAEWLLQNCGGCSTEKKIPAFVKNLSPRQIKILLDSLYAGDGSKQKFAYTLTTVSKKLADDVQELILKTGNASRLNTGLKLRNGQLYEGKMIIPRHKPYGVNWLKNGFHNTQDNGLARSSIEKWIDFDGMVYCVTVPSHVIYVRRNGIPVWCGNSLRVYHHEEFGNRWSKECEFNDWTLDGKSEITFVSMGWIHSGKMVPAIQHVSDQIDEAIRVADMMSYITCEHCGMTGATQTEEGWITTLCDKCKKEKA